jgi:hypothetical protein
MNGRAPQSPEMITERKTFYGPSPVAVWEQFKEWWNGQTDMELVEMPYPSLRVAGWMLEVTYRSKSGTSH